MDQRWATLPSEAGGVKRVNQYLKRNFDVGTSGPCTSKFARVLEGGEAVQSELLFDNICQAESSSSGGHIDAHFELPAPSVMQEEFIHSNVSPQYMHSSNISPHHSYSSNVSPHHSYSSNILPHTIHDSSVSHLMHNSNVSPHLIHSNSISPHHIHSNSISPHHSYSSNIEPHPYNSNVSHHMHNSNVSHHMHNSNVSHQMHNSNVSPHHMHNSNVSPRHVHSSNVSSHHSYNNNISPYSIKCEPLQSFPSPNLVPSADNVLSTGHMLHPESQVCIPEGFDPCIQKHIKTEYTSLDDTLATDSTWACQTGCSTSVPFYAQMPGIQTVDNRYNMCKDYSSSSVQIKKEPFSTSAEYWSNESKNPVFARSSYNAFVNMHGQVNASDVYQRSSRSHLMQSTGHQQTSRYFSNIDNYNQYQHEDSSQYAPYPSRPWVGQLHCAEPVRAARPVNTTPPGPQRGVFVFRPVSCPLSIADQYVLVEKMQCEQLREISIPEKVAYVYNPLEYAFETHYDFVKKFCNTQKKILFLGMNAGPWGMSQNGVPFGEVNIVKDWMKITGDVLKPLHEHPSRPVKGLECSRSEVSGKRFWGFFQQVCGSPETFFTNCFVHNICPLAFMSCTGKNVTPPMLGSATLKNINAICDKTLLQVLTLLNISTVVSVGQYAHKRATAVVSEAGIDNIRLVSIMHPSPCNPNANKGWFEITQKNLQELQLLDCITNSQS